MIRYLAMPGLMIARVRKSVLLKRIGVLSFGVAVGQAIAMAIYPVLTRLFDPHAFGLYGLFITTSFLIGNVSSLRYELGIVIARSRGEAAALFALSVICALFVAAGLGIVLLLGGGELLATAAGSKELAKVLPWAPIQVLSLGIFLGTSQWAICRHAYKPQATYQVVRAVLVAVMQVLAGYMAFGVQGLVAGQIFGFIVATVMLLRQTVRPDWAQLKSGFNIRRLRVVAKKYRQLPLFTAPQEVTTALLQAMPQFILGSFFGTTVVGFYWLTVRTMQLPMNFFSQSIRQVLLQRISSLHNSNGKIFPTAKRMTAVLLAAATGIFLPNMIFAPQLYDLVFGEEWREAGQ
jgi:O-antigen/teichoic acid export membrane protein